MSEFVHAGGCYLNPSGVRLGPVNTNLPPDDVMAAALGRQIAAERVAAGMSQTKLAELIGIHKNSLIRYENADRDMPWTSIEAVARALGLKTSALVLAASGDTARRACSTNKCLTAMWSASSSSHAFLGSL